MQFHTADLVNGIENTKRNQHAIKAMSEHRSTAEAIKQKRDCSCNSEEQESDNPVINAMTTPSTASVIKRKKERLS